MLLENGLFQIWWMTLQHRTLVFGVRSQCQQYLIEPFVISGIWSNTHKFRPCTFCYELQYSNLQVLHLCRTKFICTTQAVVVAPQVVCTDHRCGGKIDPLYDMKSSLHARISKSHGSFRQSSKVYTAIILYTRGIYACQNRYTSGTMVW